MATTITAGNATDGLKITPDNTGILELKTGTGAGTTALTLNASQNATLAGTLQVAGLTTNMYPIVSGSVITLTNQTAPEFTSIPSWAKRITFMFNGISTNGAGFPVIQLGDSGGYETTGYLGSASTSSGSGTSNAVYTTGFGLIGIATLAASVFSGSITITLIDSATNSWVCSGILGFSNAAGTTQVGAAKSLSATLDRVRLYIDGTQQFDAGTINIMWE